MKLYRYFLSHLIAVLMAVPAVLFYRFMMTTGFPAIVPGIYNIPITSIIVGLGWWFLLFLIVLTEPYAAHRIREQLNLRAEKANSSGPRDF